MDDHVLIWRQPIPEKEKPFWGERRFKELTTTILARGTYDEMLERWKVADQRIRALALPGHVAVRSVDDPQAITEVYYLTQYSGAQAKRVPVSEGRTPLGRPSWRLKKHEPDPVAARLAILEGDRVRVSIYGNTYAATVTKNAIKGVTARFAARTRKGGWGGEPPERERRFGVWNTTAIGSKMVEEVRI
jgi:hypothetical protein